MVGTHSPTSEKMTNAISVFSSASRKFYFSTSDFHAWCVDKTTGEIVDYDTKDFWSDISKTHFGTPKYILQYKAWDLETLPSTMFMGLSGVIDKVREWSMDCEYEEIYGSLKVVGMCLYRAVVNCLFFPEKYELKIGSCGVLPKKGKSKNIWWEYGNGSVDYNDEGEKIKMLRCEFTRMLKRKGIVLNKKEFEEKFAMLKQSYGCE